MAKKWSWHWLSVEPGWTGIDANAQSCDSTDVFLGLTFGSQPTFWATLHKPVLSCGTEVTAVQTSHRFCRSPVNFLGPGCLWYSGLYGANRWSLVGTHSLWASCPTKRLSVIVLNLCCFYAGLGSTAVVKRTKATLPWPERNKQTKP